jgi:hypothetical protein
MLDKQLALAINADEIGVESDFHSNGAQAATHVIGR